MIPSVFMTHAGERYLIIYLHEWGCKRDRRGRRIRGSTSPIKYLGMRIMRHGKSETAKDYPPTMTRHEALAEYLGS